MAILIATTNWMNRLQFTPLPRFLSTECYSTYTPTRALCEAVTININSVLLTMLTSSRSLMPAGVVNAPPCRNIFVSCHVCGKEMLHRVHVCLGTEPGEGWGVLKVNPTSPRGLRFFTTRKKKEKKKGSTMDDLRQPFGETSTSRQDAKGPLAT